MTSLEKKVLQCASGEKRLKPDECRTCRLSYSIGKC